MRIYTAHLRPNRDPVLLREGWSWAGFIFGPIWLLAKAAWIPAVIDLAVIVCVIALVPSALWLPILVGLALLIGFVGRDLARWSLARRGYAFEHVLAARDEDAAYARLFAARPDLLEPAPEQAP